MVPTESKESVSRSYDQKHNHNYGLGMIAKRDTKLLYLLSYNLAIVVTINNKNSY